MVARPGMDQVAQPPEVGLVQFEERTVAIWLEVLALRTLAPPAPDYLARRGTPADPRQLADRDIIFFVNAERRRIWRFAAPDSAMTFEGPGTGRAISVM